MDGAKGTTFFEKSTQFCWFRDKIPSLSNFIHTFHCELHRLGAKLCQCKFGSWKVSGPFQFVSVAGCVIVMLHNGYLEGPYLFPFKISAPYSYLCHFFVWSFLGSYDLIERVPIFYQCWSVSLVVLKNS